MRAQQENRIYKTALYLRLSKDDEGVEESSSITTQRGILQDYANTHGLQVVGEYVDDGFSGTNYERPAFKRMVDDIEAGRVNCVITKDLSRLGRNSARTSDLLDEYFPAHGVRYISVIDGYDSLHLTSGVVMTAPLMMAMHEMYARDISCKIRTSFKSKMENGEYIGSFAPYGYQKDPDNKNHLVVDYQVSHIVREIFEMAADGNAPSAIARYLNNKNIATPAVYRCLTRPYLNVDDYSKRREWTSAIVCELLRNIVYLGHTAQGKSSKVSFKSKVTQSRKPDEWIVVKSTHEPIIPEDLFQAVRNRVVARRQPPTKGFENIFSGIARCADCGRTMTTAPTRKKGATYNLCCGGYKTYGSGECSNHFIDYDLLYDTVLQELRRWLSLPAEDRETIVRELQQEEAQRQQQENSGAAQSLEKMKQRAQELSTLLKRLYEDYTFSRISATMYEKLSADYESELSSLEQSIEQLRQRLESDTSDSDSYREFFALLNDMEELPALTKLILRKFIDRIDVEQGEYIRSEDRKRKKIQKIRISYRFIGQTDIE